MMTLGGGGSFEQGDLLYSYDLGFLGDDGRILEVDEITRFGGLLIEPVASDDSDNKTLKDPETVFRIEFHEGVPDKVKEFLLQGLYDSMNNLCEVGGGWQFEDIVRSQCSQPRDRKCD